MTLRYRTDSWGTENNGFSLVITAFKNSQVQHCTHGFQCDSNICISSDLVSAELSDLASPTSPTTGGAQVCDGISHCGHGEDEGASNNCSGKDSNNCSGKASNVTVCVLKLCVCVNGAGCNNNKSFGMV